jgi:hypothetical protein
VQAPFHSRLVFSTRRLFCCNHFFRYYYTSQKLCLSFALPLLYQLNDQQDHEISQHLTCARDSHVRMLIRSLAVLIVPRAGTRAHLSRTTFAGTRRGTYQVLTITLSIQAQGFEWQKEERNVPVMGDSSGCIRAYSTFSMQDGTVRRPCNYR